MFTVSGIFPLLHSIGTFPFRSIFIGVYAIGTAFRMVNKGSVIQQFVTVAGGVAFLEYQYRELAFTTNFMEPSPPRSFSQFERAIKRF